MQLKTLKQATGLLLPNIVYCLLVIYVHVFIRCHYTFAYANKIS